MRSTWLNLAYVGSTTAGDKNSNDIEKETQRKR